MSARKGGPAGRRGRAPVNGPRSAAAAERQPSGLRAAGASDGAGGNESRESEPVAAATAASSATDRSAGTGAGPTDEQRVVGITPPSAIRWASILVAVQAAGLLVLAGFTVASGLSHDAHRVQLFAQLGYFVVVALLLAAVATGLSRGRRWSRTPAIVVQIVVIAIGFWMAAPSGRIAWGLGLIAMGVLAGALLIGRAGTAWIKSFPPLFDSWTDR